MTKVPSSRKEKGPSSSPSTRIGYAINQFLPIITAFLKIKSFAEAAYHFHMKETGLPVPDEQMIIAGPPIIVRSHDTDTVAVYLVFAIPQKNTPGLLNTKVLKMKDSLVGRVVVWLTSGECEHQHAARLTTLASRYT
jgi:hypothetical protein